MELKRYTLLNDNRVVEFYKNEKFGFSYIENKIDGIVFTRSVFMKDVKKTSDNILDLIEIGDLVDILFTGDDAYHKLEVIEYNEEFLQTSYMRITTKSFKDFAHSKADFNIKLPFCRAIYKLQANGDYKRYEVEE